MYYNFNSEIYPNFSELEQLINNWFSLHLYCPVYTLLSEMFNLLQVRYYYSSCYSLNLSMLYKDIFLSSLVCMLMLHKGNM